MKSRLRPNKYKLKNKQGLNNTKSFLPPNLKSLKKLLSGSRFLVYN